MAGLTPEQRDLLQRERVARLATVDDAGRPHVVPICFAYLAGALYSVIDAKPKRVSPMQLRRVRNIRAHPEVCLLVDHYDDDWSRLAWLQARGPAVLVTDPAERGPALAALRERYPPYRTMELEAAPLLRVTLRQVVFWAAQS